MSKRDIIVIGASAGGVEALTKLAWGIPADLSAAIFVVLHVSASSPSVLPHILSRQGSLRATHPASGEAIRTGRIYVAPPNKHLLIEDGHIALSSGPKENGHRPSIDALFRSAAVAYGPRVIGIVLSGAQSDGAAGLRTIHTRGGVAMVQDPDEASCPSMPRHAIESCPVDYVLPVLEIGRKLADVVAYRVPGAQAEDPLASVENHIAADVRAVTPDTAHPGVPSVYACPDCHGTLWEINEGDVLRFRCRVGHAWTAEDLLVRQHDGVEDAMWMAVRALEEKASLAARMSERLSRRGSDMIGDRFADQSRQALWQADLIRRALDADGHEKQPDAAPDAMEAGG